MANRRAPQFKPLLFTTTMRNPDRMRDFLVVIKQFEGKVLTDGLCEEIEGEVIRLGLYQPTKKSALVKEKWKNGELLTDGEVRKILDENPQNHTEAGFAKGWPSRFDTHFKLPMWFGFVFYSIGQKIEFSNAGNMYISKVGSGDDEFFEYDHQQVFLNAFARYQRKNPFQRALNENRPLILILSVLEELKEYGEPGGVGIARHELPFFLVWKNSDAKKLAEFIIQFRKLHKFSPSSETVFEACESIQGGWNKAEKLDTITREYPDDLLRKLRLTGLISLRGGGRFISLNSDLAEVAKYLIVNYSTTETFADERAYFNYASMVDDFLVKKASPKLQSNSNEDQALLVSWVEHFTAENIRKELMSLANRKASKDLVLKTIHEPLRLEFLSALLLKSSNANADIVANYRRGDDGLPISHAPGNHADIEVYFENALQLYEVTLMTGAAQAKAEMAPISRHQKEARAKNASKMDLNVETVFIAPSIHADSEMWADFIALRDNVKIVNRTIEEFASLI